MNDAGDSFHPLLIYAWTEGSSLVLSPGGTTGLFVKYLQLPYVIEFLYVCVYVYINLKGIYSGKK